MDITKKWLTKNPVASAIFPLIKQVYQSFDQQYISKFDLVADMFWIFHENRADRFVCLHTNQSVVFILRSISSEMA
jgi:hypothetical protein